MRLAYVANVRMPTDRAHGVQIVKMCSAFAEAGAEVNLIVPWRINPIKKDPYEFYGLDRSFRITKIPSVDILPFFPGKLFFGLQQLSFYVLAKLYVSLSRFDIVYGREALCSIFFNRSVFEVHNIQAGVGGIFSLALRRAKLIVPVTEGLKDALIKACAPEEKIKVQHDGVDLTLFDRLPERALARKKLGLPEDKKIVLYTGSFYSYAWKGVDLLIEASKSFPQGTVLVLVGGDRYEIEEMKRKGIGANVVVVPHRPHTEIPYYMRAADVLVLPNRTGSLHSEKYTSPLKLFEYMASGTPIVASRLPSICEVLNDNNSFLVEPDSSEYLFNVIMSVFSDPVAASRRADNAVVGVKKYSWMERAKNIMAAF